MKKKHNRSLKSNTTGLDKGPQDCFMNIAKGRPYLGHGRRCGLMSLEWKKKKKRRFRGDGRHGVSTVLVAYVCVNFLPLLNLLS